MNWYILRHSMNSKVMGSALIQVRGLHSAEIPYRDDIAKYLYEPIPGNIKVPNFKLEYRAKLTDLIKHGGDFDTACLLLNQRLLEILTLFHTPTQRVFPTCVIDRKNNSHPYYMLMQNGQFDIVDYNRSIFRGIKEMIIKENGFEYVYEDFKANNFEDRRDRRGIGAVELYIRDDIKWDFFLLGNTPFLWMVNEKVADALQTVNITGICLIPFQQGDDFVNDDIVSKAMRAEGLK